MTSWICRGSVTGSNPSQEKTYIFETSDAPFEEQALSLLYAHAFAQKEGRPLYVADQINYVSANFPLFRSLYQDISGVRYADSKVLAATPLRQGNTRYAQFLQGLTLDVTRSVADTNLRYSSAAKVEIERYLNEVRLRELKRGAGVATVPAADAAPFDVAVALGSQGRPTQAVAALRALVAEENILAPKILVLAESEEVLQTLQGIVDPQWTLYAFPTTSKPTTGKGRRQAFFDHAAQLAAAQGVRRLVCEKAVPLGLFLAATTKAPSSVVKLI